MISTILHKFRTLSNMSHYICSERRPNLYSSTLSFKTSQKLKQNKTGLVDLFYDGKCVSLRTPSVSNPSLSFEFPSQDL